MSAPAIVGGIALPPLTDPIPNLLDKYGGAPALKPIVIDYCTRVLTNPSTRRCFGGRDMPQIIEHSFALLAAVLGKPSERFDFRPMRAVFDDSLVSQHAYEEMVMMARQVLLDAGFASRDACIAVNVFDIYSEGVFGVRLSRTVRSPYAGVDRRRTPRAAEAAVAA